LRLPREALSFCFAKKKLPKEKGDPGPFAAASHRCPALLDCRRGLRNSLRLCLRSDSPRPDPSSTSATRLTPRGPVEAKARARIAPLA